MDRYSSRLVLWVFFYVLMVGAFVQGILLPFLLPSWHAGEGLLKGHDWVSYHRIAAELADRIRSEGWRVWELRPHGYGWIEPGVAAAIYAVTVSKPWVLLPLNALIHALSALCLYEIYYSITVRRGRAILVATLPFVLFPSSLIWTVQIHKDGGAILGLLTTLVGWSFLLRGKAAPVKGTVLIIAGLLLTFLVRAYWGDLLLVVSKCVTVLFVAWNLAKSFKGSIKRRDVVRHWILPSLSLFFVIPLALGEISLSLGTISLPMPKWSKDKGESLIPPPSAAAPADGRGHSAAQPKALPPSLPTEPESLADELARRKTVLASSDLLTKRVDPTLWNLSPWLPYSVDAKLAQIARVRHGFAADWRAHSKIDFEKEFHSAMDFVRYFPRAFQIALFAPFPSQWVAKGAKEFSGGLRKLVGFEMILFWIFLPFVFFFWVRRWQSPMLWLCLFVCFLYSILFVYAVPNLGTIHRFRYIFQVMVTGFGILGVLELKHAIPLFPLKRQLAGVQ